MQLALRPVASTVAMKVMRKLRPLRAPGSSACCWNCRTGLVELSLTMDTSEETLECA